MAKDIKLLISGNAQRAEATLRELQRTGREVTSILERDFQQLGMQSSMSFDQKRQSARSAYEKIKSSGLATGDELVRAEKALGKRLQDLDEEQYGKRLTLAERFRNNWVKIAAVAGAIAGAGVAAVSLGKKAVEAYGEFETELTNLGKVTNENLDEVRERIMALPPELGSATEMVRGYYQVISAGVTEPKQAMDLLITAAKAAKAAHVDQGETIKGITKLMAGFSGEIKTAAEAADLMFAIEKLGQTSFQELVPIIGDIASLSHQAGVNQYEMGAAMSQLTQTAGSTSQASTQYRAILMSLIKPTSDMTKALEDLGYSSGTAAVEQRGFAGILQDLQGYADDAGIGLGKLFGSSEALIGLGPLLASNFDGYNAALYEMENSAGSAQTAFEGWKGTFAAVKAAFHNSLGKVLIDLGKELVPQVIEGMKSVTDWISNNRSTIVEFAQTIGATISWVADQFAKLMSQMNTTRQWYQAWKNGQISTVEWAFTGNDAAAARLQEINAPPRSITDRTDGPLFPGMATGAAYVPRTGYYQLHRGEEVRTRGEVSRDTTPAQITIAPEINITMSGASRGEAQQTARELARLVEPELRKLSLRYRHAL